jgi:dTDP-glucose 4,6-dehydratase
MRVLVTGAAGFVASHYVRTLLSGGYPSVGAVEVTVVDRLAATGNLENLGPVAGRFRFVQGDVHDARLLDDVLPGHDAVVSAAVESCGSSEDMLATNVLGASSLLSACSRAGIRRVVHLSTAAVYGRRPRASAEDDRLDPVTPFAASKAAADVVALSTARTSDLELCVVRAPECYGPYSGPAAPLPALLTGVLDGERPAPAPVSRDWLHVDDFCRAVQLVLERGRPGDAYNVGGSAELTDAELLQRLSTLIAGRRGSGAATGFRPGRQLDDRRIRQLGYRPLVDFDEGLTATVQWYQDNESWWRPLREKLR